ncbi:hypothetical protein [Mucilaginibacter polytrichastri]|uniref:Lipocalin-like domain-containing protein n=1 Tax=Mucilaginibacter polytrichastri TaxID=1302689 RepID=A0A1Q5ZTI3_9SPHI|nr:hypothetical protein [Mucilaginibacter polytrichastri]OKS85076.1 hypothetical protein RG47T_0515 [Mucilaginibacter polytrichastri]SFS44908.1 hypothetical protein SAMN04487890_101564 [Mucilaginibacter polytrichastri]
MKNVLLIIIGFTVMFATSCSTGLDTKALQGKWKYVKVGVPNSSPPDTVTTAELEENKPYIEIKADGNFNIMWGGKLLSHGSYKISGKNLNMHELLPGGQSRDFPFFVSSLTDKQITFETVDKGGSQVTAVKE